MFSPGIPEADDNAPNIHEEISNNSNRFKGFIKHLLWWTSVLCGAKADMLNGGCDILPVDSVCIGFPIGLYTP